jgi:anti-sigma B factor antagonist
VSTIRKAGALEEFSVTTAEGDRSALVTVTGDVDLATAERLAAAAQPLVRPDRDLVVDCSGIRFLDSAGLRVLLELNRRVHESGADLVLVGVAGPVARVLELGGVRGMFTVRDSATEPGAS